MKRKVGKFTVTTSLIESSFDDILPVFEGIIVVKAEHLYHKGAIEYIGMSNHFRELEVGESAPEYMAECTRDDDGDITVRWVEQK